ncbi:MAG: tetratricopeptide repeat protein, partial [Bacteroidales bacterium]|nr:tetratricopeptide repeat protein [Bacteroidales bacterium]
MVYEFDVWSPEMIEAIEEELKKRNSLPTDIQERKNDYNNIEATVVGTKKGRYKYGIIIGVIIIAAYIFNAYTTDKENESIEYYNKGVELDESKDYHGAIDAYTKAIELNPKLSEAYYNRGLAKYNIQDYNGAIADCTKAIELNPKDAEAYNNRGLAKDDIQDFNSAIADYTKAIELNPKLSEAYNNRSVAKINIQDYNGAIADCTKAIELNP